MFSGDVVARWISSLQSIGMSDVGSGRCVRSGRRRDRRVGDRGKRWSQGATTAQTGFGGCSVVGVIGTYIFERTIIVGPELGGDIEGISTGVSGEQFRCDHHDYTLHYALFNVNYN